jgi:hypothetical protein
MGDNGWSATQDYGARVADDFTIPLGQSWDISKIRFFLYQPLTSPTTTFPGLTLQIWNGQPGQAGSSVIWGDTSRNVLMQNGFSGAYRYNDGSPNTVDPIMWFDASVNFALSAGTYWLDWSATRSDTAPSDIYQLPITINGQRTTGNALYMPFIGQWGQAFDIGFDGINAPQGFPFQVYVPEPSVGVLVLASAVLCLTGRAAFRRARS